MAGVLRVGVAQMELRPARSVEAFDGQVAALVDRAAGEGARLVVFPELVTMGLLASRPGYDRLTAREMSAAYRTILAPLAAEYEAAMRRLAVSRGVWLLAGSHWRGDPDTGHYQNTAHFFHPDGRVARQNKLHLTKPEEAIETSPGEALDVVDIGTTKLGITICYDVQFPEVVRALALRGVEVLLCPALTYSGRASYRVRYCCHARAIENQLFVVMSPLLGTLGVPTDAPLVGRGRALVAAPIDKIFRLADGVLALGPEGGEAVVVADLDLDRLRESRARSEVPTLRQLRPQLYARARRED